MATNRNDDLRMGSLFDDNVSDRNNKIKVALIGYSVDEGVRRNGGRVGARKGPEIVMEMLKKKGCIDNKEYGISLKNILLKDFGSTEYCGDLKATHKAHKTKVLNALHDGYFPIIIGGGNDQSHPNYEALSDNLDSSDGLPLSIINIDAHLDVRPLFSNDEPHSGTPFRQILEGHHKQPVKLTEFGAQGNQCSASHVNYVNSHNGTIVWLRDLSQYGQVDSKLVLDQFNKILNQKSMATFLSLDIDCMSSSDCPGVSCPSSIGLSASQVLQMVMDAGSHPSVRMLDISEFNPDVESYRTAVLVSNIVYYFLLGLVTRH